jgi:hypothetical protein
MGVKCGNVSYPAVPPGDGILRISVNARHTRQDLERCVDAITTVADNYGILGKTKEEIREIGERLASKDLLAEIA